MTGHVIPPKVYLCIFVILLVLMVLTIVAAEFDLGWWNPVIAMGIATAKAVLVILYFMHVRFSSPLSRVFVVTGFIWMIHLMVFTMMDYVSRPWSVDGHPSDRYQMVDERADETRAIDE